jgi:hypothetical protein
MELSILDIGFMTTPAVQSVVATEQGIYLRAKPALECGRSSYRLSGSG